MPYNAAGNFSPIALEPYNIENTLAPLAAAGSPATARLLLSQYGLERDANKNLYTDEINNQRAMGYAALHQQMVDRAVKTMADAAQHPEMAPYLFGSQYGQEAMGPGDPQAYHQLQTNLGTAASLGRAKTAAEVIQAGSAGGGAPDLGQLSAATGLTFNPVDPTSVRAAAARAAGQPDRGPRSMIPISLDPGQYGRDPATMKAWTTQVPVIEGEDPARTAARQEQARQQLIGQATSFKNSGTTFKPTGGGTGTNLPPNPQGDTNPATNPLLGNLPGTQSTSTGLRPPPPGTTYAQPDTGSQPSAPTGGAQAAPVTPPKPPAGVRPANMPDAGPGDKAAWMTPAGMAAQRRARTAMASLPPQVQSMLTRSAISNDGMIPLAVKDNVVHFVAPDGSDLGVVQ